MWLDHIFQFLSKEKSESKSEVQPLSNKDSSSNKPLLIAGGLGLALAALLTCQSFRAYVESPQFKGGVEWNKK